MTYPLMWSVTGHAHQDQYFVRWFDASQPYLIKWRTVTLHPELIKRINLNLMEKWRYSVSPRWLYYCVFVCSLVKHITLFHNVFFGWFDNMVMWDSYFGFYTVNKIIFIIRIRVPLLFEDNRRQITKNLNLIWIYGDFIYLAQFACLKNLIRTDKLNWFETNKFIE